MLNPPPPPDESLPSYEPIAPEIYLFFELGTAVDGGKVSEQEIRMSLVF